MRAKHQPRIKGVKRCPAWSALHPTVREGLEAIAEDEGRSVSWVVAEALSLLFDIDCETGKKQRVLRFKRSA